MIINPKLSDKELFDMIYKAAKEYANLIGNSYLIIGKNKNSDYFWFQCYFEKKHFMHLLGIDSKTLSAMEFYNRCDTFNQGTGPGVTIKDCTPSRNHNRRTINEKCSCCKEMFCIQDATYMKVGVKDLISQYVDFTYGYGTIATLGFKEHGDTSFPITLIPKNINTFVTKSYKILFVLKKPIGAAAYDCVMTEKKKGLFQSEYESFPEELKKIIK